MSTPHPRLAAGGAARHPAILGRRTRERLLLLSAVLVPTVLALAISVEMPTPGVKSVAEILGILLGIAAVIALMVSRRYTVTLTLLALYLGLLDGPVKLITNSKYASGIRDILMLAIALGMLSRLPLGRQRVPLPPLSAWIFAFIAFVLAEAFNPGTGGFLKSLGGYRQQLEFVPMFFFAYLMLRSKQRLRRLFLIFGVIALANGIVGTVQERLSPGELAAWGPGYSYRISGRNGRTFVSEGVAHPRPPALGSDAGFGGGVGVVAMPGLIALLSVGRLRRRWPVLLCSLGALAGIATSASRSSAVILIVAIVAYVGLSLLARLSISRVLLGLVLTTALAAALVTVLVAEDGAGLFKRQTTIAGAINGVQKEASGEAKEEGEESGDAKVKHLNQIPSDLLHKPFGQGLGSAGAVAAFGGKEVHVIEEQKVSGGSAYNILAIELGAPGLFLWLGLTVSVLMLGLRNLSQIEDRELRTYLVAILAIFVAIAIAGFVGPTLAVTPDGVLLWLVPGVIAYWLAGPGLALAKRAPAARPLALSAISAT